MYLIRAVLLGLIGLGCESTSDANAGDSAPPTDAEPVAEDSAVVPAACNPCTLTGVVDPQGAAFDQSAGAAGLTVAAADATTTTDSAGRWTLDVPPTVGLLRVSGAGVVDAATVLLPRWLDDFPDGLVLNTLVLEERDALYADGFGLPPAPGTGLVVINAALDGDGDATGVSFELDVPHGGAFSVVDPGIPTPGNVTGFHGAMMFPNANAGPATLTFGIPPGIACDGPTELDVVADGVTTVLWRCQTSGRQ